MVWEEIGLDNEGCSFNVFVLPPGPAVDNMLLFPGVQAWWTEHGDRATLVNWLYVLLEPKDTRDAVGRWSPSGSDEYIRTSKAVILVAQRKVASMIRQGHADAIIAGEEEILEKLKLFLTSRGLTGEAIESQCSRLRTRKDYMVSSYAVVPDAEIEAWDGFGDLAMAADVDTDEDLFLPSPLAPGQIVISKAGGKRQTLHQVGRCWRVPGVHYLEYETLSESDLSTVPKDLGYQRICRDCFPTDSVLSESESSSESDS
jgi:hypothetical protein